MSSTLARLFSGWRWLGWTLVIALLAGGATALWQRRVPAPPPKTAPRANPAAPESAPESANTTFNFFSDKDGAALGRLQIGRVTTEGRREGFIRVAFRPMAVLQDVTFEIGPQAAWPETGTKILAVLRPLTRNDGELRNVRLHIEGAAPQHVHARLARVRGDGALEMIDMVDERVAAPPATRTFWLAGPWAGQWHESGRQPPAPPPAATAAPEAVAATANPFRLD